MFVQPLAMSDPLVAARALSRLPGLLWLDSAARQPALGRYSFVAADPFGTFRVQRGQATWNGDVLAGDPLDALRQVLARFRQDTQPGIPPFQGGAAGFLTYEFGARLAPIRTVLPLASAHEAILNLYDVVLAFDHAAERAWLISTGWPEPDTAARAGRARRRAGEVLAILESRPLPDQAATPPCIPDWSSNFTAGRYREAVREVIELILEGDIFQANIAQRFTAAVPAGFEPFAFYQHLRAVNPATFAAFLDFGEVQVASSSPERLFCLRGRRVESRPIKGTIRRSADPAADGAAARALLASEKDRAENVMIVDLVRNDLSRVCEPWSVKVPALCGLESYAGVHHLVSVVEGELAQGKGAADVLRACFPGGSITGAPKARAMEIIGAIEAVPRDIYCGAIGYLGFDGASDMNIAIRTVTFRAGTASFHAGGGITARSEPDAEYRETLVKADRILAAFGARGGR